jgi:hypothetical protein
LREECAIQPDPLLDLESAHSRDTPAAEAATEDPGVWQVHTRTSFEAYNFGVNGFIS